MLNFHVIIFLSSLRIVAYPSYKVGHNGPEDITTTYRDEGCMKVVVGLEVGEMSVRSMREMWKQLCPNLKQPFLEYIYRRTRNDGSRDLIPVFHNPHRKEVAFSLEGL